MPDTFARAAELIADPSAWTTGAMARDAAGREVAPLSPDAVAWDALGAVMWAAGRSGGLYAVEAERRALTAATGRVDLAAWNDAAGHDAVVAALLSVAV